MKRTKIITFEFNTCFQFHVNDEITSKFTIQVELVKGVSKAKIRPINESSIVISNVRDYEIVSDKTTEDYQLHITTRWDPWVKGELIVESSQKNEILYIEL